MDRVELINICNEIVNCSTQIVRKLRVKIELTQSESLAVADILTKYGAFIQNIPDEIKGGLLNGASEAEKIAVCKAVNSFIWLAISNRNHYLLVDDGSRLGAVILDLKLDTTLGQKVHTEVMVTLKDGLLIGKKLRKSDASYTKSYKSSFERAGSFGPVTFGIIIVIALVIAYFMF